MTVSRAATWNRPELTAERFVPDPFSQAPGGRLYRTGDQVRWLADGTIEFVGRLDQQVKIRGFRIEPGELEAAIAGHPAVREAAVVVQESAPGERRLVAYVVPDPAASIESKELRAWLKTKLPEYLLPAALVWLERLPLSPNGKVDRAALPAPRPDAERAAGDEPEAMTEVQRRVADIWSGVLEVPAVSTDR